MKQLLLLPLMLIFTITSFNLHAQGLVKIALDNEDRLIIKKNANGDLQLVTPPGNLQGNFFLGNDSGNNIVSSSSINGVNNLAIGNSALRSLTTGSDNLSIGIESLSHNTSGIFNYGLGSFSLYENVSGNFNIAIGSYSLYHNVSNNKNIAIGYQSLANAHNGTTNIDKNNIAIGYSTLSGSSNPSNNTGYENVVIGNRSLKAFTTAYQNVAVGDGSMEANTTGSKNAAIGAMSLNSNTGGFNNVSVGYETLKMNETGSSNTAVGVSSMLVNTTGDWNTAIGASTMVFNTTGHSNVAIGSNALNKNTVGNQSVAIGVDALKLNELGDYNTAIGSHAGSESTGSNNVFLGYSAGWNETGSNKLLIDNISLGNPLIYGDFLSEYVTINEKLGIGTEPTEALHIRSIGEPVVKIQSKTEETGGKLQFRDTYNSGVDIDFNWDYGSLDIKSILGGEDYFTHMQIMPLYATTLFNGSIIVTANPDNNLLTLTNGDGTDVLNIEAGISPFAQLDGQLHINTVEEGTTFPDNEMAMVVNSKFSMNSSGQIKIGLSGTPQKDIHIKQSDSSTRGIRLEYGDDTDAWDTYIDVADDYNFAYNGILAAYIQDGTGNYVTSSDRSLKNNIQYLGATLDKINALKLANYTYKNDKSNSKVYGLIAQELQEIYPEMVSEKDGKLGVAYTNLIPVALKGIQELSAQNTELQEEIAQLKEQLAATQDLEARLARLEALMNNK